MNRTRTVAALAVLALCGCAVPAWTTGTAPAGDRRAAELPPVSARTATVEMDPLIMDGKGLDPRLAAAFGRARADAARAGISLRLTSAYRSPAEQEDIFRDRVRQHGSERAARRWALRAHESMHVRGLAIDVGPVGTATSWLERHQERYGICRRYLNEPWHFELKTETGPCRPLRESAAVDR